MAEAKATLSNYRQSPRKVRLIADLVRGKSVDEALTLLSFVPKRAALPVQKLIASAVSNAENLSIPRDSLVVGEISVDGGKTLFRRRPMSRGRAFVIRKRTSHVSVTLKEKQSKLKSKKTAEAKS